MKKFYAFLMVSLLIGLTSKEQVTLTTSPYTENFDNLGSAGIPQGFSVKLLATPTFIGRDTTLNSGTTPPWRGTRGGYKNFASNKSLNNASADSTTQSAITNRALGIRQTGSLGDSGAAFVFQISNTIAKQKLKLNFNLQSLDSSSPRTTTWIVDYGIGNNPVNFSPMSTNPQLLTTGNKIFNNTDVTVDFGTSLDNSDAPVTIRVVTLSKAPGSGSRASTAIDNWSLSWEDLSTSLTNINKTNNAIRVSGNIASTLNLHFTETKLNPVTIQLIALNGRTVYQKQLSKVSVGQTEMINGAHLQSGVYLLNVISKDSKFSTKLVK